MDPSGMLCYATFNAVLVRVRSWVT